MRNQQFVKFPGTIMAMGGKRPGAGRRAGKHGTKVAKSIRVSAEVAQYLDDKHAGGIGDFLDGKVRATQGFKDWLETLSEKNTDTD